jgi:hypothetical protein
MLFPTSVGIIGTILIYGQTANITLTGKVVSLDGGLLFSLILFPLSSPFKLLGQVL